MADHFSLVLQNTNYNTFAQGNRGNMTTMPPVNFNRLFCHKSWLEFLTVLSIGWWHGHVDNCCNGVRGFVFVSIHSTQMN